MERGMDVQNRPQSRAAGGSIQLGGTARALPPEEGGAGAGVQRLAPRMAKPRVATTPAERA